MHAALCALILALLLPAGAIAAGPTYTLTLNNTGATDHTFEIYQIFVGDLAEIDGKKVLSNIVWGDDVNAAGQAAFGSAAEKAETLETEADARTFANALVAGDYLTGGTTKEVAAGTSAAVTGLTPGYYLIKDRDGTQTGEDSAYTAFMLEIVGDATASTKLGVPSVEKKVRDINDSEDGDISDNAWQDSADHDVGDVIPYIITGTLPSNFASYTAYFYEFTDKMDLGLTYQADARVYLDGVDITDQVVISPAVATPGATLTITIADLKAIAGVTADSSIAVRYTARLNENAVLGRPGNSNTVYLTYSNDPNPGGTGTASTPKDKTVVFTYQLVVNKSNELGAPLVGADFSLYKKNSGGAWELVKAYTDEAISVFNFVGLDDGDYKLVETAAPEGFNKMEDLEFTISAVHEASAADPKLISLNGIASGSATINLTSTQEATANPDYGTISTRILNKAGAILPSTGGIGTKLFYVAGGALAVGAAVLLITKKRMQAEE